MLDELRELLFEGFLIVIHQLSHVIGNVGSHNVFTVNFGIELLRFRVITRETFGAVRHIDATINGAFHGTKDAGTGGGTSQTNIEVGTEGSRSAVDVFNVEDSSSHFSAALVDGIKLELLQQLL